jgi:hypothetical protein
MRRELPVPLVVKQSQTQKHTLESLGSLDLTTHVVHQSDPLDCLRQSFWRILMFFDLFTRSCGED